MYGSPPSLALGPLWPVEEIGERDPEYRSDLLDRAARMTFQEPPVFRAADAERVLRIRVARTAAGPTLAALLDVLDAVEEIHWCYSARTVGLLTASPRARNSWRTSASCRRASRI